MESMYKGTAELGRFQAKLGWYIGLCIGIIMVIVGIYLLTLDQSNLIDSTALVTKSNCTSYVDNKQTRYNCVTDIKYTVEGKQYEKTLQLSNESMPPVVGQNFGITFDKANPAAATASQIRSSYMGLILIGVAVCIIAVTYYSYYLTSHYEVAAAAQGTGTALSFATAPFRTT
jgi:hypothetical protein